MLHGFLAMVFLMSSGSVLALPPQPPTNIQALAGNRSATITWSPPQDDGGSPIISYTVYSNDGKSCSVFAKRKKCTIKKLKNLNWYSFYMVSVTNEGVSDYSEETPAIIPYKKNINAVCGSANNLFTPVEPNPNDLCATGTPTEILKADDGLYYWSCIGYKRGATTDCQSIPYTQPKVKVGDKGPAGGTVFYVTPDGYHGLEAAPVSLKAAAWACETKYGSNSNSFIGATDTGIGTGFKNTQKIQAACQFEGSAAKIVKSYSLNGLYEWFIPSKEEMKLIINTAGLATKSQYWTSSEIGEYYVTIYKRDLALNIKRELYLTDWYDTDGYKSEDVYGTDSYVIPVRLF